MPKVKTQIENVGEVELNVQITLSLADWQKIVGALNGQEIHSMSWPFFWLRDTISDQIKRAQAEFEATQEHER